jgi:hypothetical protein
MINSSDPFRLTGLDTLSERALRRLVKPWTGELHSADTLGVESVERVADQRDFDNIVEAWRKGREIYVDGSVEQVMGEGSSLSDGVAPIAEAVQSVDSLSVVSDGAFADSISGSLTDSLAMAGERAEQMRYAEQLLQGVASLADGMFWPQVLLNLFVFAVVIGYMFCIYRYFDDVVALFSSVFSRSVISADRVGERRRSDIFYGFLGKIFLLGAGFVGVMAMLWAVGEQSMRVSLTQSVMMSMPLIAIAVFLAIIVFQYVELILIGAVTRSLPEVFALMRLRLTYFVFFTVVSSPILLVSQMGVEQSNELWQGLGLIVSALVLMLYLRESLLFFISQKISILHWFLYLCTVEILPLTLLWQLVVRI